MDEQLITDKSLIRAAKTISAIFTPFSIPFVAFAILFLFTYLNIMPMQYKLIVLGIVFSFTIMMPVGVIYLFQSLNKFTPEEMTHRKQRFVPFILTIISYAFCLILMYRMNLPWFLTRIILTALLVMIVCVLFNLKWKLSEHMAGAGAIIGGLVAFGAMFGYNPVWWLCIFILATGALGTARIALGRHTLGEVLGGCLTGLLCSLLVLHPVSNLLLYAIIQLL